MVPLLGVPADFRARLDQRPYWKCGYLDGRTLHETQGLDWAMLPREGMAWLELQCPNGKHYKIGNSMGASFRLFQFKVAEVRVDTGRRTQAHIIGLVNERDGRCTYWLWDTATKIALGPKKARLPTLDLGPYGTHHMDMRVIGVDLNLAF